MCQLGRCPSAHPPPCTLSPLIAFPFYFATTLPSALRLGLPLTPTQMILAIGSVAYFLQASDLGFTAIATEFSHYVPKGTLRQVWYARWVDYVLTMPLLVLLMFFLTGLCTSDMLIGCFMAAAWPACFLIGMLIRSTYKWPFFTFGCVFLIYLWYILLGPGRVSARRMGGGFGGAYFTGAAWYCFMTLIYPIAWGCCEGGNTISTTSEFVWYGILDLLLKPFFLIFFLLTIGRLDLTRLQLYAGKYTDQNMGFPPHVARVATGAGGDVASAPGGAVTTTHGAHPHGGLVAVDNHHTAPRKKFFSRKGAHDAPVSEKPTGTGAGVLGAGTTGTGTTGTTGPLGTTGPGTTTTGMGTTGVHDPYRTGNTGVGTGADPVHSHNTRTRTVVHGHSAEGEPRMSEATAVSGDERYP